MSSKTYLNIIMCITLGLLAIGMSLFLPPRLDGDGWEYTLVTEALLNHQSFDVSVEDVESHLQGSQRGSFAFTRLKQDIIAGNEKSLGFLRSDSGSYYAWHFGLFSLFNAPAKALLKKAGYTTDRHFQITNALFVCVLLVYLLLYSRQDQLYKVSVLLGILLCGGFYYFGFTHPELFITVCIVLAFTAMLDGRYVQGMFFAALMGMQNTSFLPTVAMIGIFDLLSRYLQSREVGIKAVLIRAILPYGFIAALVTFPFGFNMMIFGKLTPLSGAVSFENITLHRLYSFFFDLSQGMIVGYGLVLPVVFLLMLNRLAHSFRDMPRSLEAVIEQRGTLLLLVPFLYSVPLMTNLNWNSGMVYVMRYAFTAGIPWLVWMSREWTRVGPKMQATCAVPMICFLVAWNVYPALLTKTIVRGSNTFPYQARMVLDRWPQWYSPYPEIFSDRMKVKFRDEPIHYRNHLGEISKVLIRRATFENARYFDIKDGYRITVDELRFRTYPTIGEWGYISTPVSEGSPITRSKKEPTPYVWKTTIALTEDSGYDILRDGWDIGLESSRMRTDAKKTESTLRINLKPATSPIKLSMDLHSTYNEDVLIEVNIDNEVVNSWTVRAGSKATYVAMISSKLTRDRVLNITLRNRSLSQFDSDLESAYVEATTLSIDPL